MPELPTQTTKQRVNAVINANFVKLIDDLNDLHEDLSIPDEDILAALREDGYDDEAEAYQEMIAEDDPSRDYREPNPPEGVVPDPHNPSYEPLVAQLQAARVATSITYEWTERERMIFKCKATVNRSQLLTWLRANVDEIIEVEEVDAEMLVEFLEAEYSAVSNESRLPADSDEIDYFDIRVVPTTFEFEP